MSTVNASAGNKLDVCSIVTDRIIGFLEQGIVPWHLPFTRDNVPINMISKREYRGINLWTLLGNKYEQNLFVTFDQLKSIGGSIKRGETGHVVAYAVPKKKKNDASKEESQSDDVSLRYYKVFNASQTTDIPAQFLTRPNNPITLPTFWENIVSTMPNCPTIKHKGQTPHYDGIKDIITMPSKKSYGSEEQYYAVLFEQLVCSTMHESRLGRFEEADQTGSTAFPRLTEKVVADMGSSYLSAYAAATGTVKSYSVEELSELVELMARDKKFIVRVGTFSQRSVDVILNKFQSTTEDNTDIKR